MKLVRWSSWLPPPAGPFRRLVGQFDPDRRVIAGPLQPPDLAVDAGCDQPRRKVRRQQDVVDPKPCVPSPTVPDVVPEGIEAFGVGMRGAERVGPALRQQRPVTGAG